MAKLFLNLKIMRGIIAKSALLMLTIVALSACGETVEEPKTTDEPVVEVEVEEPTTLLEIDKDSYEANETIKVTFDIVEDIDTSAWVGIIPSDTAHGSEDDGDSADVSYRYLSDGATGSMEMNAPEAAGEWDVRIYSSDTDEGVELASISFEVEETEEEEEEEEETEEYSLSIDFETVAAGSDVTVAYTAPEGFDDSAWVGIIPSDVEHGTEITNDANDVSYRYADATEGTLEFTVPTEAGSYDFRFNDTDGVNGVEVASVTFIVE